ncbi:DHA2 family efflux MFS transporter permease subunit [Pseudonocardia sp. RS11V-5]|uniref:DHA2 family efflux MFS transporter permease subunit n=1 Tax=Pseudonocardia terrae TaxID=2905831 RepID=UPI001E51CA65|nr:DHA2 family efflux MFS transporter permease subunit [Pseudonocardia terrae]MCE3550341.1 DHA2 family efflux MFS transporter permease subunit [Pseudonocardia terrae]
MTVWDPATRRIAAVVVLGALLSMLDATVVAVGLESMARDLGAGLGAAQWIAHSYLLALAVALPACGWSGRRIGAGRLWVLALAGFTVASVLCALAPTLALLVGARVLQGIAAGFLVPTGQALLGQAVGPERLGRVMAVLGAVVSLGPALGPVVGGVLLEVASWPWLFLVNVPIGLVGVVAGVRVLPRGRPTRTGPLDLPGMLLAGIGLSALVYGLTAGGEQGAPLVVGGTVLAGGIALALFVVRSLHRAHPVTDLRLFSDRRYATATVCSTLTGASLFGTVLVFPLLLQLGRGTGTVGTGLALLSYGLATAASTPLAGRLTDRFGGGVVAAAGCVGLALTAIPFALAEPGPVLVQVLLVLRGIAIGFAAIPPTVAAYAVVRREQLPDATTQLNALQRVGGAVGGALVATTLATLLPQGAGPAFAAVFWLLAVLGVLALIPAVLLARQRDPVPQR